MRSTTRLYLTSDRKRVVEHGDPDASELLVGEGGTLAPEDVGKFGLERYVAAEAAPEAKAAGRPLEANVIGSADAAAGAETRALPQPPETRAVLGAPDDRALAGPATGATTAAAAAATAPAVEKPDADGDGKAKDAAKPAATAKASEHAPAAATTKPAATAKAPGKAKK